MKTMNKFNIGAVAVAVGLALSAGSMAQNMTKDEYKAGRDGISAQYKSAKANCNSFAGNVKDICRVEAMGNEKVAKADLDFNYKPSDNTRYEARVARAQADYAVAKERCDDKAGNAKDVCLKEASAAQIAAKADAKAQMKVSGANKTANEKTTAAHATADEKSADARNDAAEVKRDADFAVAKEKCDVYSGDAKNLCVNEAKAQYGKS